MKPETIFVAGFITLCLCVIGYVLLRPETPAIVAEPPKPTTEIDMAKRDHDIAACRARGLTPVMGFGWAVVCVEEQK